MFELIVAAALVWPAECEAFGELYRGAALIRDAGRPRKEAMTAARGRRARLALIHVYERADMSPSDWRWLAIGICVGQSDPGATKAGHVS
jgi:hypothetical protein